MKNSQTFAESIRRIRSELIALDAWDGVRVPEDELDAVRDAWDRFEYAAGTVEGGDLEVIS